MTDTKGFLPFHIESPFRERGVHSTLLAFSLSLLFLAILFSYLPIAFQFSLVNFTYGSKGLEPGEKQMLPLFYLIQLAAWYAWEVCFRGFFLRTFAKQWSIGKAFWVHLALINLILLPWFSMKRYYLEDFGMFRFWFYENLLQTLWAFFFLRTGSVLATGFLHGTCDFIRMTLINDIAGPFETFYFYSAATDNFYWLLIATAAFAIAVQISFTRRWGMRELRP